MATVVLNDEAQLQTLLESRRRSGMADMDEVWEGVLHMVPAPNYDHGRIESHLHRLIGEPAQDAGLEMIGQSNLGESEHDFRVPDSALHPSGTSGDRSEIGQHETAALVVEIVSPNDETWLKLPFYAAHGVQEVLIVDPREHAVHWLALDGDEYRPVQRSGLIELGPEDLIGPLGWA
jgi:Uma2 family endonuclease